MRAYIRVLDRPPYHGLEMSGGLRKLGYEPTRGAVNNPEPDDILVTWNRYPRVENEAKAIEKAGGRVVVVENGYFGRNWRGGPWYALSIEQHNGLGKTPPPDLERWKRIDYPVSEWQPQKQEVVIIAQRGIGSDLVKSPKGWEQSIQSRIREKLGREVRIRPHPGPQGAIPPVSLENDLKNAYAAVTWASSAGLKAIMMGIPTYYGMPNWIGRKCAMHVSNIDLPFHYRNRDWLKEVLATAMWNLEELRSGEGFECLLGSTSTK